MRESEIQQQCIKWFHNTFRPQAGEGGGEGEIIFVPNELSYHRSNYYQTMGVRKGCSDLIVVLKGKVLFIEMKTPKGKQSPEQIDFQRSVEAMGYEYYVVRSLDEFIYRITQHASDTTHPADQ